MTRVVAAALAGAAALAPLDAQQPQFRAGTRTVPVYVTVVDRSGAAVLDLTVDDFEIRDNGRPQPIAQFTTAVVPLSVVLLLDGSGSMMESYDRVLDAARSFVVRMLPDDRARIGSFADSVRLSPRFTSDRDELLRYLADEFNLHIGLSTHLWEALIEGVMALRDEPGKRVVLALTDGHNWVEPDRGFFGRTRPGDVISRAVGRDVMVYAVSMWVRFDSRMQRPNAELERLAVETGGSAIQLREVDEINTTFSAIARELREQYLLGFAPPELDGRTHRLDVRVKRPGLRVQARRSYVAEAGR